MALRLILALAALAALWWGWRKFSKAPPEQRKKLLLMGGLGLLVAVGVLLLISGKMAGLFAIIAGLSPWVARAIRLHALWQGLQRMSARSKGDPDPGPGQSRPSSDAAMTRPQAYEILGLAPGASEDDIREAHRRLMRANHPDAGGSTWIAARLNQARDLLLG